MFFHFQMGVENLSGQYVRAVYPFDTSHPREINLSKGDIIRVVNVIDDNWYCGELRGQKGNFPSSFVETLSLPAVEEGQKLYGAIENFPAQQDGDLEFRKGKEMIMYPLNFCKFSDRSITYLNYITLYLCQIFLNDEIFYYGIPLQAKFLNILNFIIQIICFLSTTGWMDCSSI